MQFLFDFVQQIERILSVAVQLVDEHDHRCLAHSADLHEFTGLCLHTFGNVDDDDDTIYSCQCTEGVFRKVLVTRCVQNVDFVAGIIECHDGGSYRDTTLLLDFHPVGRGRLLDLVGFDCTGYVDRSTKQQQFFGKRCLTGIRVTDDCKCSSSFYLF